MSKAKVLIEKLNESTFSKYYDTLISNLGGKDNLQKVSGAKQLEGKVVAHTGDPSSGWMPQVAKITSVSIEASGDFELSGKAITGHDQAGEDGKSLKRGESIEGWYSDKEDLENFYVIKDVSKINLDAIDGGKY